MFAKFREQERERTHLSNSCYLHHEQSPSTWLLYDGFLSHSSGFRVQLSWVQGGKTETLVCSLAPVDMAWSGIVMAT